MQQNIYSKDLLVSLDKFERQMYRLNRADSPEVVVHIVTKWTKAQPLLTKKLLQYVLESKQKIALGDEAHTVEKIVRTRLIKEFKQDELTLNIRKLLYAKDLIGLINRTRGNISTREKKYLQNLQNELGLSNRQCQSINNRCLLSGLLANSSNKKKEYQDNYRDLISLVESPSLDNRFNTVNTALFFDSPKAISNNLLKTKKFWLAIIAFLLTILLFNSFQNNSTWQKITTVDAESREGCTNLTNSKSSRMSLGGKLLTQKYRYSRLPPDSKVALYEATAAFGQCEYSTAKNKFQTALKLEKNNPEALIYLNNATAIVRDHYKIAVSVPLGNKPEIAWEILRGVAQAQTEINQQGGIEEKLLLLQIVDDNNDPQIARQVARRLTADRDVLAVIGHNDSNTSIAASDIYQQQGLVMISPTSSSTQLSGIGSYIMRTTPSVAVLANTLASYTLISDYSKVAICFDPSSSASKSFAQEFTAEMIKDGGEILPVECNLAQENFNPVPVVEQAISQNADAILLAASLSTSHLAIAVAQANQQRLPLLGNHSLYTFETIQIGQEAVAGMVLSAPWLPEIASGGFSATTMDFWGGQVNWRTAMAHDAAIAIIQGLKQSDSRPQLQSVLTRPDFQIDGATGIFRFKQGDRAGKVRLAYIATPDQNHSTHRFAKLNINNIHGKSEQSLP